MTSLDQRCVDALRFLAIDSVQKANSGHPGMPLGAAPMAYVLWDRFLRHSPSNPSWFDRDRFVLSAGHGSALLYALLHVFGYDLPMAELERFRQWGSRTPGHPEYGLTPGVEATTGPLGQGFAMGVGMAMAEAHLASMFPGAGDDAGPVSHATYAIVSDGDLMEGVASEAASLAGHLRLGKIVYLYDDNHITIEGQTRLAFTESVGRRFEAYGWHVQAVDDGNDLDAIERAIRAARDEVERPSLVRVHTHIGFGSPRQDSEKAHGEPLGEDGVAATRERLGWEYPPFEVPGDVLEHCRRAVERGRELEKAWRERCEAYRANHPERAELLASVVEGRLPEGWDRSLPAFEAGSAPIATRSASSKVINALAAAIPTMIGGSADLASSNKTLIADAPGFGVDGPEGRNVHFGVREHAMGGIVNGMALHGGVVPFGATFLIFSDYMRPAIRLAALMRAPSTFVFTHDSIGLGEDGPTHQPVEQLAGLRAIPDLVVMRPADGNETAAAWRTALARRGPCLLALTRQKLPILDPSGGRIADGVPRGAYVLADAEAGAPAVVLIATGSEVQLALAARSVLAGRGVPARVVSMPSWELFREQPQSYRDDVLLVGIPRVAVEAGASFGWREWVGDRGAVVALDRFGASAPGAVVMEKLGFDPERVADVASTLLG